MSHWILDALILRWAELTARLSKYVLKPSKVIDRLLVSPIPERDVGQARKVFQSLQNIECVWSGKNLKKFDIDHVIPFSFWRNNDLWNLLPTQPEINFKKRDKLPTNQLLKKRKDAVIYYWEVLMNDSHKRFSFEAEKLAGLSIKGMENWEAPLFAALVEAIEVTSLQRGCARWEP